MRRTLVLVLLFLLVSPVVFAGQGRVIGTVVDETDQAMKGVRVTIRSLENNIVRTAETNKKGRFTVSLPDHQLTWVVLLEAEGYPAIEEPLGAVPEGPYKKTWKLAAPTGGSGITPEIAEIFNEGALAQKEGKLEVAKDRFEAALALSPELEPAWRALGPVYLQTEENEKAIAMAEKLLALNDTDPLGLKVLHDANENLGRHDVADKVLARLVEIERSPEVAARVFNSGASSLRRSENVKALERFRQALEIDPKLATACSALGNLLLSQQDFAEALAAVDACLPNQPDNVSALTVRFNALRALGREEEADKAFADLQAGDPEAAANVTFRQGEILFEIGNTKAAVASFEKTLATDPDHPEAHYKMGLAMINLGKTAEAKEHLGRYLELDPEGKNATSVREMLEYLE